MTANDDGPVINQLRPLYRRLRDLWHHSRPAAPTGLGFRFVGSQLRFRCSPDEQGTVLALQQLAPGLGRFINVGANAGFYSLLADRLGLEVLAFEPEPAAFRLLQRNLALNDARCLAIPAALGSHWQRCSFFGTGTAGSLLQGLSGTPVWDQQRVTVVPFDQIGLPLTSPSPAMLWLLDCEGAEPRVLQGAQQTLQQTRPLLILEWQPQRETGQWGACVEQLLAHGYTHLLACSSLLTNTPLTAPLTRARLQDSRFCDNVLIYGLPHHQELMRPLLGLG